MKTEEIIINGVVYPVAFGMRALDVLCKQQGNAFGDLETGEGADTSKMLDLLAEVLKVALNEGARKTKVAERYDDDDVIDLFDSDPLLLGEVTKLMTEGLAAHTDRLGSLGK